MRVKDRWTNWLLLACALLLAIWGQYAFSRPGGSVLDGIVLYGVGMLLFSRVMVRLAGGRGRDARRPALSDLWRGVWQALRCSSVRLLTLVAGVAMSIYVAVASQSRPANGLCYDLLGLWVLGIMLTTGSFLDWAEVVRQGRGLCQRLMRPNPELVLVGLVFLAAILVRAVDLADIPAVLSGDEAAMGLEALDVLEGRRANPFATGWFSHPTLYFYLQAAFVNLFGATTQALRLSSVLVSSAATLLLYVFTRRYFGRWVAVLSMILYATYHYAIHYGRMGLNNIWDPFWALGAIYFLGVGLARKRIGPVVAGSVFTGLSVYFYMGARLVPLILCAYLLHWGWRERGFWRENAAYLVIFVAIASLIALPLLAFFRAHPADLMARWSQAGIFPSGWVDSEMQRTGKSTLDVLWGQFLKSVLAFNYTKDTICLYCPGTPLLLFSSSVLFVFGLTHALSRWSERAYFLLVAWFLLVVVFGGMLLENPPKSPRLVLAIPPVVICVALGMVRVSTAIQTALRKGRGLAVGLSLILLAASSYRSLHFYFAEYTPEHVFADPNTQVADAMGKYLSALGPAYRCYFFGAPRIFYTHATIPFLARGVQVTDVLAPLQEGADLLPLDQNAVFVLLPERRDELDVVRRSYPEGRLREFRDARSTLLFVAYEVNT